MASANRRRKRSETSVGRSLKIAIVDYGLGNIGSIKSALSHLGVDHFVSSDTRELRRASAYILPGVGAFSAAIMNLRRLGLDEVLHEEVRSRGKHFMGICLGLQLLAEDSTEEGFHQGLGWIKGHVVRLQPGAGVPVPHVGWVDIKPCSDDPLFDNLPRNAHFYFDHSYHLVCDPVLVTSWCGSTQPIIASIRLDNIRATQFHPEKSQRSGLKLLRNFCNLASSRDA